MFAAWYNNRRLMLLILKLRYYISADVIIHLDRRVMVVIKNGSQKNEVQHNHNKFSALVSLVYGCDIDLNDWLLQVVWNEYTPFSRHLPHPCCHRGLVLETYLEVLKYICICQGTQAFIYGDEPTPSYENIVRVRGA